MEKVYTQHSGLNKCTAEDENMVHTGLHANTRLALAPSPSAHRKNLPYKMISQTCRTKYYRQLAVQNIIANLPYLMLPQTCRIKCYLKNLPYKMLSQTCRTRCYLKLAVQKYYLKLVVQNVISKLP